MGSVLQFSMAPDFQEVIYWRRYRHVCVKPQQHPTVLCNPNPTSLIPSGTAVQKLQAAIWCSLRTTKKRGGKHIYTIGIKVKCTVQSFQNQWTCAFFFFALISLKRFFFKFLKKDKFSSFYITEQWHMLKLSLFSFSCLDCGHVYFWYKGKAVQGN